MTVKSVSEKQIDLIVKHASLISALGITVDEAKKDTWRASGVLGRILSPSERVLGALKVLNARPFYLRSSREAEMQMTVLESLQKLDAAGVKHDAIESLRKYFAKRETV